MSFPCCTYCSFTIASQVLPLHNVSPPAIAVWCHYNFLANKNERAGEKLYLSSYIRGWEGGGSWAKSLSSSLRFELGYVLWGAGFNSVASSSIDIIILWRKKQKCNLYCNLLSWDGYVDPKTLTRWIIMIIKWYIGSTKLSKHFNHSKPCNLYRPSLIYNCCCLMVDKFSLWNSFLTVSLSSLVTWWWCIMQLLPPLHSHSNIVLLVHE